MKSLRAEVQESQHEQALENAVRKILGKIKTVGARGDIAEHRFIWELLQNCCDTATSCGRDSLRVTIELGSDSFTFAHDAGWFNPEDIGALILGGSAKPFDNRDLTGRFGTGFLLSHAVSRVVTVCGWRDEHTAFAFTISRTGDSAQIKQNFDDCYKDLDCSRDVFQDEVPGDTKFKYQSVRAEGRDIAQHAIVTVDRLLPYVFAFNRVLTRVQLTSPKLSATWSRATGYTVPERGELAGLAVIPLSRSDADGTIEDLQVQVFRPTDNCLAAAVIDRDGLKSLQPQDPRVYFHFPLEQSADVGLPVAVHGPFEVDEGRTCPIFVRHGTVASDDASTHAQQEPESEGVKNAQLFEGVVQGVVPFLAYLATLQLKGALQALAVRVPGSTRPDAGQWAIELRALATCLMSSAIVRTEDHNPWLQPKDCRFPSSSLSKATQLKVDLGALWDLGSAMSYSMCKRENSEEWGEVLEGWRQLGVETPQALRAEDLLQEVRDSQSLSSLAARLSGNEHLALTWLTDLLDLLSPHANNISATLLDGTLPNQAGTLTSCASLQVDKGVDPELKAFGKTLGDDLGEILLDRRLSAERHSPRERLLSAVIQQSMTNEQAVIRIVETARRRVNDMLADSSKSVDRDSALTACVRLALWLAKRSPEFDHMVRDLPFITADWNKLDREPGRDPVLLPSEAWSAHTAPYVDVFPESSRLASAYYLVAANEWPELQAELVRWGVAVTEPVITADYEFKTDDIAKLVLPPAPALPGGEQTYLCHNVSRIPRLNDVTGRIGKDEQRARLFLTFILTFLIARDESWRRCESISLDREKQHQIDIRPSQWLAWIRRIRWVPDVAVDLAERGQLLATRESLKPLIPWSQIADDKLTSEFLALFDFDLLEVWIRSNSHNDPVEEGQLRNKLAQLALNAAQAGLALEEITLFVQERKKLQQSVKENRDFGFLVQELLKAVLEDLNLHVEVVDRGYDFEVYAAGEADTDTDCGQFEIGKYLVEVKAIRGSTSKASLTPLQAKTAVRKSDTYVVCVVDLRSVGGETFQRPERATLQVRRHSRFVMGVGKNLRPLVASVEDAASRTDAVWIDRTQQLRYCLGESVWDSADCLEDWAKRCFSMNVVDGAL
jgi:hypothetical protein